MRDSRAALLRGPVRKPSSLGSLEQLIVPGGRPSDSRAEELDRFWSFSSVAPFDSRAFIMNDVQKIWAKLSETIQITGEDSRAKVFYSDAEDRAVTKGFTACSVVLSNHYMHEEFLFEVPIAFCGRLASNEDWCADQERFVKCNCGEAAIMLLKAALFGHLGKYREIVSSRDPAEIKTLGAQVENFDDEIWCAYLPCVALEVVWQKFTKVRRLGQYLVDLSSHYEYLWSTLRRTVSGARGSLSPWMATGKCRCPRILCRARGGTRSETMSRRVIC